MNHLTIVSSTHSTDLTIEIEAGVPSPTDTGVAGGMDVDVTVHIGGAAVTGAVTLIRRESDGEWSSWGSRDHWCSQELLDVVDAHPTLSVLDGVLAAASEAVSADSMLDAVLGGAHLSNPIIIHTSMSHGVRTVADPDGGVWVPSDEAQSEIQAAGDPDSAAMEMCSTQPMRGSWHA